MEMEQIKRRREYVSEIRSSFDADADGIDCGEKKAAPRFLGFVKIRLLLALCAFAVFFHCYDTSTSIAGYSADQIIQIICDNHYYTNLKTYVKIQAKEWKGTFE